MILTMEVYVCRVSLPVFIFFSLLNGQNTAELVTCGINSDSPVNHKFFKDNKNDFSESCPFRDVSTNFSLTRNNEIIDCKTCNKTETTGVSLTFPDGLRVEGCSREVAGNYTLNILCNGTNNYDDFTFFVYDYPEVNLTYNGSVSECRSNSTSAPEHLQRDITFTWLANGKKLSTINECVFVSGGNGEFLHINSSLFHDVINVTCEAKEEGSPEGIHSQRSVVVIGTSTSETITSSSSTEGDSSEETIKLFIIAGALAGVALLSLIVIICLLKYGKKNKDRLGSSSVIFRNSQASSMPGLIPTTNVTPVIGATLIDTYSDLDMVTGPNNNHDPWRMELLDRDEATSSTLCDDYSEVLDQRHSLYVRPRSTASKTLFRPAAPIPEADESSGCYNSGYIPGEYSLEKTQRRVSAQDMMTSSTDVYAVVNKKMQDVGPVCPTAMYPQSDVDAEYSYVKKIRKGGLGPTPAIFGAANVAHAAREFQNSIPEVNTEHDSFETSSSYGEDVMIENDTYDFA